MLDKVTKETGNIVNLGGRPLSPESFLDLWRNSNLISDLTGAQFGRASVSVPKHMHISSAPGPNGKRILHFMRG